MIAASVSHLELWQAALVARLQPPVSPNEPSCFRYPGAVVTKTKGIPRMVVVIIAIGEHPLLAIEI